MSENKDMVIEKSKNDKFLEFDWERELTDYELEHFDEFMAVTNSSEDASKIDIEGGYEDIKDDLFSNL
ncbi:MAG: hypothetical protein K0U66_01730 [Gammaproteobacteria bacterium]|nr:hypothetical protein [Gammaproteobacteria bacterium]